jgi:hypothetical protein
MKRLLMVLFFLGSPCVGQAEDLGRLFFTPEQRAALDAKRSGGRSTVFINGDAMLEGTADAPVVDPERRGGRLRVPTGEGGQRVELRPGEVLDRSTGQVRDVLGEGGRVESGAPRAPARK